MPAGAHAGSGGGELSPSVRTTFGESRVGWLVGAA